MSRLIDADALLERMREYANDDWNNSLGGLFTDTVDTCIDFVECAETIEAVEVVHGEWTHTGIDNEWECSHCKRQMELSDDTNGHPNFCPNCGADMRKGGEEHE